MKLASCMAHPLVVSSLLTWRGTINSLNLVEDRSILRDARSANFLSFVTEQNSRRRPSKEFSSDFTCNGGNSHS